MLIKFLTGIDYILTGQLKKIPLDNGIYTYVYYNLVLSPFQGHDTYYYIQQISLKL